MDNEQRRAEKLAEILYRPIAPDLKAGSEENEMSGSDGGVEELRQFNDVSAETFENLPSLRRVELPEGIVEIGYYAFAGCRALSEVVFPSTVKDIMEVAFQGCDSLKRVVIPNRDCIIREGAFPEHTEIVLGIGNDGSHGEHE